MIISIVLIIIKTTMMTKGEKKTVVFWDVQWVKFYFSISLRRKSKPTWSVTS